MIAEYHVTHHRFIMQQLQVQPFSVERTVPFVSKIRQKYRSLLAVSDDSVPDSESETSPLPQIQIAKLSPPADEPSQFEQVTDEQSPETTQANAVLKLKQLRERLAERRKQRKAQIHVIEEEGEESSRQSWQPKEQSSREQIPFSLQQTRSNNTKHSDQPHVQKGMTFQLKNWQQPAKGRIKKQLSLRKEETLQELRSRLYEEDREWQLKVERQQRVIHRVGEQILQLEHKIKQVRSLR